MSQAISQLRERFAAFGQDHVFRFWDTLAPAEREALAAQAAAIDLEELAHVHERTRDRAGSSPPKLEPAAVEALPRFGGGEGTRLGFEGPKGLFPLGPATGRTLFELQAQRIRAARRRYGVALPWYVMTSPATDAETRRFFREHDHFGLDVFFLCQSTAPALDFEGRLLLETPGRIAVSPNGHGGAFPALADSGALDDMERRGITTISYYQVDNPLVRLADPVFVGLHDLEGAEMSAKVVRKIDPMEKVGVLARMGGRVGVVEYTEIDDENRHRRDADGQLVYWAGSIAIHAIEVAFARRVAGDAEHLLPYHASAKKVPYVDAEGRAVRPEEPNAHKLERFLFDALPAARHVALLEVERSEEYAPVKNAEGGDSPATARAALDGVVRCWLAGAGVAVPEDVWVEVDHAHLDDEGDARRMGVRDVSHEAVHTAPRGV